MFEFRVTCEYPHCHKEGYVTAYYDNVDLSPILSVDNCEYCAEEFWVEGEEIEVVYAFGTIERPDQI